MVDKESIRVFEKKATSSGLILSYFPIKSMIFVRSPRAMALNPGGNE